MTFVFVMAHFCCPYDASCKKPKTTQYLLPEARFTGSAMLDYNAAGPRNPYI